VAQFPFRLNLQSMVFPLLSELSGRTVINPGADQTFVPGVSISADNTQVPVDRGTPQVYYLHNVMPSTYGYQSIGYVTQYEGIDWQGSAPSPVSFDVTKLIQGAQLNGEGRPVSTSFKTYISNPRTGTAGVMTLDPTSKRWKVAAGAPSLTEDTRITVATVNGVSYIYFSKLGCYIYNNSTNTLIPRILVGLDASKVLGIISSNGYLLAYTSDSVAWSSVTNVEDFAISDVSGAGGGSVQEAKGKIITAAATSLGFILYTAANAVSVIYSGNADFPWNFKGVPSSGGVSDPELVSEEQTGGFQQVYTTNGLQRIGHTGAQTTMPQVTDFVSGNLFEDYDPVINKFTTVSFDWSMRKGLGVIADRYVVISYGLDPVKSMTHALVMDLAQSRLGKLKIPHNFCFELKSLADQVIENPRGSLAMLQSDGTIKSVDFTFTKLADDAVMLLGKFQLARQRMVELFTAELENVKAGSDFKIDALPSLDGKNLLAPVEGYLLEAQPNYRNYAFDSVVGINVSLSVRGRFNLISAILWLGVHGRP
jgi:hypothetical protein